MKRLIVELRQVTTRHRYQTVQNAPARLPGNMRGGYEDIFRNSRKSGGASNPARIFGKRKQACILVIAINESIVGYSETTVHVCRIA